MRSKGNVKFGGILTSLVKVSVVLIKIVKSQIKEVAEICNNLSAGFGVEEN